MDREGTSVGAIQTITTMLGFAVQRIPTLIPTGAFATPTGLILTTRVSAFLSVRKQRWRDSMDGARTERSVYRVNVYPMPAPSLAVLNILPAWFTIVRESVSAMTAITCQMASAA